MPTLENPDASLPLEEEIMSIAGCRIWMMPGIYLRWFAPMRIDGDGSGGSHGDPDFQPDTSYHRNGRALNADNDPYVVVPKSLIGKLRLNCMGSVVEVYDVVTRRFVRAVAGDVGPSAKIGEASIACANAVGVPGSPLTGGEDRRRVHYVMHLMKPPALFMPSFAQGHVD